MGQRRPARGSRGDSPQPVRVISRLNVPGPGNPTGVVTRTLQTSRDTQAVAANRTQTSGIYVRVNAIGRKQVTGVGLRVGDGTRAQTAGLGVQGCCGVSADRYRDQRQRHDQRSRPDRWGRWRLLEDHVGVGTGH
ncbi:hypothetical protein, partial [Actinoplanes derwentensis]|uniref:hypothetical protein n=1 Tax=Actinoplanes derwentensis TaxID=113562 RepID=UPI001940A281